MKKLLLGIGYAILITANLFAQERADKPKPREGDIWQFQSLRKRATGFSRSDNMPDGTYMHVLRQVKRDIRPRQILDDGAETPGGLFLTVLLGQFQDQPLTNHDVNDNWLTTQDIKFPLFVGKKWEYTLRPPGERQRNVTVHVVKRESVKTIAGTFEAFRIERNVNWAWAGGIGTGVLNIPAIYFYSEETNSIIKMTSEHPESGAKRQVELIRFGSSNESSNR